MPGSTARGLRYPLSSEPPAGHTNMQTLAGDTNERLAIGGTGTYPTDAAGVMTIAHGLGRVPLGFAATVIGSTTYMCCSQVGASAATSTNFQLILFRRDTGAIVVSGSLAMRWVAY